MLDNCQTRSVLFILLLSASLASASGCSSIKSTLYTDDGCQTCEKVTKHLKGVPTTLTVPTHLHVYVLKTRWGKIDPTRGEVAFIPELEARSVHIEKIVQKEIFTVDFKRPASGYLAYNLKFDVGNQYITKIDNSLEDKTIASVAGLISQVLQSVPTLAGGVPTGERIEAGKLAPFPEIIASELFALNEPQMQERIQTFLDVYLNQCDRQCGGCAFPGPPPPCITGDHGCKLR